MKLIKIKWLSQKIPSLRAFPQDSSLNLLPIYYLRIEPWYALKLLRIDQTGSAHQYWPTIDWKISYSTVQAAFPTPYTGRTGTPLFSCPCYAVGAEKALLQAVFRARIWRGKGFIPYPPKPRFYCVTNPKQRSYELWQFSEWNETRAIP